jgi:hypothetical protein
LDRTVSAIIHVRKLSDDFIRNPWDLTEKLPENGH